MMSAVEAEEEAISMTRTEPTPAAAAAPVVAAAAPAAPTAGEPAKPTLKVPTAPAAAASPESPLPPVIDGIEGIAKKPDKWEAGVTSLKGWFSEALQVTKETAQTAQRAVAGVGVRRDTRPRILCIGDSLTERADDLDAVAGGPGWGALLRARYGGRGEVLTRGASGYNSRWGLSVLPRVMHSLEPACVRVCLLWYGANDACASGGPQHVPLDEYRYNLTKLANFVYSFKTGTERVMPILVTPPALCDEMQYKDTNGDPKRSAARTKEYADACVEVACGLKVPFVDVHSEMLSKADGDASEKGVGRFLTDGLHLNGEGNKLAERLIVEVLENQFKKWAPSSAPDAFAPWKDINVRDPEATLGPVLQL